MPRAKAPMPPNPAESAAFGRSVIAKFSLLPLVDSHNIVVLLGGTIDRNADALPKNVENLIDWLINAEYLQVAPTLHKRRKFLQLHDRFASPDVALDAFKLQFCRELQNHAHDRQARVDRLQAMATIPNFRGA